jgi:hypothetical protein
MGMQSLLLKRTGKRPLRIVAAELVRATGLDPHTGAAIDVHVFEVESGSLASAIACDLAPLGRPGVFCAALSDTVEEALGFLDQFDPAGTLTLVDASPEALAEFVHQTGCLRRTYRGVLEQIAPHPSSPSEL